MEIQLFIEKVLQPFIISMLQILQSAIIPALAALAGRYFLAVIKSLELRLGDQKLMQLRDAIIVAISAVEKLGLSGQIADIGSVKKAKALEIVQAYVDSKHLNIPVTLLEAEIENAVHMGLHQITNEEVDEVKGPLGFSRSDSEE